MNPLVLRLGLNYNINQKNYLLTWQRSNASFRIASLTSVLNHIKTLYKLSLFLWRPARTTVSLYFLVLDQRLFLHPFFMNRKVALRMQAQNYEIGGLSRSK